jgi:hypothetical protein
MAMLTCSCISMEQEISSQSSDVTKFEVVVGRCECKTTQYHRLSSSYALKIGVLLCSALAILAD